MILLRNHVLSIMIVIFFIVFGVWSTRLSLPFVGSHDNHSAWVLLAAKNYLHYGHFELGLVQYIDAEMSTPTPQNLYHNHPPLISIWLSFFVVIGGDSEFVTRLSVMLPSLITVAGVFQIGRLLFSRLTGVIASAFFITSPVIAFYGQMLAHEQFIVLFYTLALIAYISTIKRETVTSVIALGILSGLCVLSGWGGYLCIGVLGLHSLLFYRRPSVIMSMIVGGFIGSMLWMLPASSANDEFWATLYDRFIYRSGQDGPSLITTVNYWYTMIWARIRPLYSEALLLMTAGGACVVLWRTIKQQHRWRSGTLALSLLIPHALYLLVLSQSAFQHDYTVYYLSVGAVILSACFVVFIITHWRESIGMQRTALSIILILFIGGHVASSARWTVNFYERSDDFAVVGGAYIRDTASPETEVYANVGWWPALWYYAGHNVNNLSTYTDGSAVLLDCNTQSSSIEAADLQTEQWICDVEIIDDNLSDS